eukprot:3095751-Prymnesium_polylepis.2
MCAARCASWGCSRSTAGVDEHHFTKARGRFIFQSRAVRCTKHRQHAARRGLHSRPRTPSRPPARAA